MAENKHVVLDFFILSLFVFFPYLKFDRYFGVIKAEDQLLTLLSLTLELLFDSKKEHLLQRWKVVIDLVCFAQLAMLTY